MNYFFALLFTFQLLINISFGKSLKSFQVKNLKSATSLELLNNSNIKDGSIRSQHFYKGLKVIGSELLYHIRDYKLESISGRRSLIENLNLHPKINKQSIQKIVKKELKVKKIKDIELIIYPTELKTYLAYQVKEEGFHRELIIYVDAHSGEVLDSYNSINHGHGKGLNGEEKEFSTSIDNEGSGDYVLRAKKLNYSFETRDFSHIRLGFLTSFHETLGYRGKRFRSSSDHFSDKQAIDAHDYMEKFLGLLKTRFGRNSYDGKGAKITSYMHVSPSFFSSTKNYPNAFFKDGGLYFGDLDADKNIGYGSALDIVIHEITHGITRTSSQLVYRDEPGALNESFSDIMATYGEYHLDSDKFDWSIGEDVYSPSIKGDAIRYLNDPIQSLRDLVKLDIDKANRIHAIGMYERDHYEYLYKGQDDNGGVHLNSGIPNLAFYLLSAGGSHPRIKNNIKVPGIGIEKAMRIFYKTFTERLTSYSRFEDARDETIKVAIDLYGRAEGSAVRRAWAAVGL